MKSELIKKAKNYLEKSFEVDEQIIFWKNHGKCEKTQRYEATNNQTKKELFGTRTKLSHIKNKFQKLISHKNENNMILHFYLKEGKLKKLKSLQSISAIKKNILYP